jgi:tellurite resistance-related uncharacterized protein
MTQTLPDGLEHVRTTPVFDNESVPPGLLAAHRIAEGVWGRLVVHSGSLLFRFEDTRETGRFIAASEHMIIPPGRAHRIELGDEPTTFAIEFHRRAGTD